VNNQSQHEMSHYMFKHTFDSPFKKIPHALDPETGSYQLENRVLLLRHKYED